MGEKRDIAAGLGVALQEGQAEHGKNSVCHEYRGVRRHKCWQSCGDIQSRNEQPSTGAKNVVREGKSRFATGKERLFGGQRFSESHRRGRSIWRKDVHRWYSEPLYCRTASKGQAVKGAARR